MMNYLEAYPWNVRVTFLNLTDNQLNMYKNEFRHNRIFVRLLFVYARQGR